MTTAAAPKLVVATSFSVHPPRGGGQARVAGLYGALARQGVEVEIVSLVEGGRERLLQPAPGVRERQVAKTLAHGGAEWALQQRAGVPVSDLALALHHELTPDYGAALADAARGAAALVACHPYPHAAAAATGVPLVYEAQDVELDLKSSMYANVPDGADLVEAVRAAESGCCAAAAHIAVCSERDGDRLGELYGTDPAVISVVPNGADPAARPFVGPAERRARRAALGLGDERIAVFVGSWHEPNLVAVRELLTLAEAGLDGWRLLVLGSSGLAFVDEPVPDSVDLCGTVDERFLATVLGLADAALNPMRWGSGSNLKMADYALTGIPIVATRFGARGLGLEPGIHYVEAEPEELPAALATLAAEDADTTAARARAAREHIERSFAWDGIARRWLADPALRGLLGLEQADDEIAAAEAVRA